MPLPTIGDKERERTGLAAEIEAFIASGGQITDLGRGVDAIEALPPVTGKVKRRSIEQTQARIARAKSREAKKS